MQTDELLKLLLIAADDVDRRFDHREIARWPNGSVERFIGLGLLRETQSGLTAPCPSCADGHTERVEVRTGHSGKTRWFVPCPESLRVEVAPEMCRGWEVDPDGLAVAMVASLGLRSPPTTRAPSRLWRLGRIPWRGKTREVVLARRLGDPDAASIAIHMATGGRAIVLVPHHVPDARLWGERVPAVVAISSIATVDRDCVAVDAVALAEAVEAADHSAESRSLLPVDPQVKRQVIRSQVKAEIKGHLDDDVLVAAYEEFSSGDKAAAALTDRLGRPTSRDKVYRAVERARKAGQLAAPEDSASVARTVASQPRDRAKKISQRR